VTPFLHFRSWLRSGPVAERGLTTIALAAVVALLAWASVPHTATPTSSALDVAQGAAPTASSPQDGTGTTGGAAPATTTTGGTPGSQTGSSGSTTGTVGGSGGPTGGASTGVSASTSGNAGPASSCGPAGSTDQGVSATTVTIGVVIVDLGAAGSALALPSAADQRKAHQAVFDDLNRQGGLHCRKVVPHYYTDSTLDPSEEHSLCLQMVQDRVFAVYNNFFNVTEQTCIAKQKIPNIWFTPPHTGDVRKYAPYIISWHADFDHLIHQYIAGAKTLGFFSGMKKLGIIEGSCYPDENVAIAKELRAVGVDPGKASVFNYGCPASPAAPNPQGDQQAALKFKRDGVTHVVNVAYGNDSYVASAADQQGYHPKFAKMEDASASGLESASQKPPKSWEGTLLITTMQTGAPHTPGYRWNAATNACTKVLARAGVPSAYSNGLNSLFGLACVDTAMLKAASEQLPALTRAGLALGLSRAGVLDLAYPAGLVHVTDRTLPNGGQFARPGKWVASCNCWHLTDVRWHSY
jgi:hypothetical protein